MKQLLIVIAIVNLVCIVGTIVWLKTSAGGFSALQEPTSIEKLVAQTARKAAVPARMTTLKNPTPNTPEILEEARAHWADHCANCHANNGSGDTEMGRHLYPRAPDMRGHSTQNATDGELFYIIENGIRLSGMPGWGGTDHSSEDSWKLVRFIRHLPRMPEAEATEMEKLNPKSAAEWQEEKDEQEFLKGNDSNVPAHSHTH